MVQPNEALDIITGSFKPVNRESISLFDSLGRVMAAPVRSRRTLPPADTSFLDGYAVRSGDLCGDLPIKLKVNGVIPAGKDTSTFQTPSGTCWRIMTGTALPCDTNVVVRHEDTDNSATEVTINSFLSSGFSGARKKGEESLEGDITDHTGEYINMAHIAEMAVRGAHYIQVYRRPRIAVISTGGEIADPAEQDSPMKIFDSNSFAIKAILEGLGCDVSYGGVCDDEPEKIIETLRSLHSYDMIISTGGVSAGDFDYFARMPEKLGIEWRFFHVRQRPAQPVCYGMAYGTPFFALPGTPVGSILCTELYVKPAVKALAGLKHTRTRYIKTALAEPINKGVNCVQYNVANCLWEDGVLKAYPKSIANYSLKTLAAANAFIEINNGCKGEVAKGTEVNAYIFDPFLFL